MKPVFLVASLFGTAILGSSSSWQSEDDGQSASGLGASAPAPATASQPIAAISASDQTGHVHTSHVKRDDAQRAPVKRLEIQALTFSYYLPASDDSKYKTGFFFDALDPRPAKWSNAPTQCILDWTTAHEPTPCADRKYQFAVEHLHQNDSVRLSIEYLRTKSELWSGSANVALKCGEKMVASQGELIQCRMTLDTTELTLVKLDAKAPSIFHRLEKEIRNRAADKPADKVDPELKRPHEKPSPLPAAGIQLMGKKLEVKGSGQSGLFDDDDWFANKAKKSIKGAGNKGTKLGSNVAGDAVHAVVKGAGKGAKLGIGEAQLGIGAAGETAGHGGDLFALARRFSDMAFDAVATSKGFKATVELRWQQKLYAVRHALGDNLARLGESRGAKLTIKGLEAAGVALWAYAVFDAYTTKTSDWDKASAVFSIIPFAGCVASLGAGVEKPDFHGGLVAADTTLCVVADVLLLTPAWPVGIILHLSRMLVKTFEPPPELPKFEEIQASRDRSWDSFINGQLISTIADKVWRDKLEAAVTVRALDIWARAADSVGLIQAGMMMAQNGSRPTNGSETAWATPQPQPKPQPQPEDKKVMVVEPSVADANISRIIAEIWDTAEREVVRHQREQLLSLPTRLHKELIEPLAKQYEADFIANLKDDSVIKQYPGVRRFFKPFLPDSYIYGDVREFMDSVGEALAQEKHKLPLPGPFTAAYYVGVAAGIDDPPPRRTKPNAQPGLAFANYVPASPEDWTRAVNESATDPALYLIDKTGKSDIGLLVTHTAAVILNLVGKLPLAELPTSASNLTDVLEFHIMIAIYLGNKVADWKEIHGNKVGYIHEQNGKDLPAFLARLYNINRAEAAHMIGQEDETAKAGIAAGSDPNPKQEPDQGDDQWDNKPDEMGHYEPLPNPMP